MTFLEENFILPLIRNGWFNPYNTAVYGLGLILGFFLVLRLLRMLKVKADSRLMAAVFPFIILAAATRALRDYIYGIALSDISSYPGFLRDLGYNYSVVQRLAYEHIMSVMPVEPLARLWSVMVAWFPTPGSYLITFIIALAVLAASVALQRKGIAYWRTMSVTGIALAALSLAVLPITRPIALVLVALFFAIWAVPLLAMRRFLHSEIYLKKLHNKHKAGVDAVRSLFSWTNTGIVCAHLLDAAATFTALTFFGFSEQHVLPRAAGFIFGPVSMFILKIAVLLPVLWLIDRYADDEQFKGLLKIAVLVLGMAPGVRDMLTLAT